MEKGGLNTEDMPEKTVINELLKKNGWKVYADTTLRQWKKKDLIELIRCLEHNYSAVIERQENTVRYMETRESFSWASTVRQADSCKHGNNQHRGSVNAD